MVEYNDCRSEEELVSLRPVLYLNEAGNSEIELFQNSTLRPILKLQHNLILDFVREQANFDAILAFKQKRSVFLERLRIFLQQPVIKGILLGMIIGQFTQKELAVYLTHAKECNKRIAQMCVQRIADSY